MNILGTRLVSALAASTIGCFMLLHLLCPLLFPSSTSSPFLGGRWTPWNAAMEEKVVSKYISMLVEGKDKMQFRSTGFSCHKDVHTHVCLLSTQVRIQAHENQELRIYQPCANPTSSNVSIKPYARQEDQEALEKVSPVHIFHGSVNDMPRCNVSHKVTALVFSLRGFSGNLFHEFSEIIIPLFLTCHHFKKQVQFVVTDLQPFMVKKYKNVFDHLSDYELITLQDKNVHCFKGAVVGLKFHSNLGIFSTEIPKGYDMSHFSNFLRESYSLKGSNVRQILTARAKPVLLLISRRSTRVFLNEDEMVAMMTSLGYNVIVANPNMTEDLGKFSKVVNKCSVIVGAHGAGMTNLVFLPAGAVVIQVVPLGLDWASDTYFGEPLRNMDLKYILYKIEPEESSLVDKYGRYHSVITDPMSVFLKGYRAARATYVDGQNLKINLTTFRETLIEVQKLLNIYRYTD